MRNKREAFFTGLSYKSSYADLFGSSSSLSERAVARLSQSSHASSEELKGLVSDIFVSSSISVLSPKLS